ncbi:hypothetical protein DFH09DRAFT_1379331 [Mycena vulgaris]|nr:hypothetical protein DFH09DRAFT_1379331 [Mycena vulgaris]
MPAPPALLSYIGAPADFIARLGEVVLAAQLRAVDVTLKQVPLSAHIMDRQTLDLPSAILGKIGDPRKKTVVYGHFDVQPAALSDGWTSEPFVLAEEKDGRLVGRGSSDDKGPVLGWVNVLQWHHETQTALPVNLVFCFEGMDENGNEGLDELVEREKDGWFKDVDCSDNYWLNMRTPPLTYGLHGLVYFKLTISGPARDLQSGGSSFAFRVFGRTGHEDILALMGRLVAPDGSILVPGADGMVSAAGVQERALYDKLDYSIADVEGAAGAHIALSADKVVFWLRLHHSFFWVHP